MNRLIAILALASFLGGCRDVGDPRERAHRRAIGCAKGWNSQGYHFDPNSMTCWQMFQKALALQELRYWKEQGYDIADQNLVTPTEVRQKGKDFKRARYWHDKGYTFDANSMTALQMDRKAEALEEAKYWGELGYYYDPNSDTVYLTKSARTKLSSLAVPKRPQVTRYGVSTSSRYAPGIDLSRYYKNSTWGTARSAENGSYYGEISKTTGRPKTVYVNGYFRKDGTYVRSHYRSPPR